MYIMLCFYMRSQINLSIYIFEYNTTKMCILILYNINKNMIIFKVVLSAKNTRRQMSIVSLYVIIYIHRVLFSYFVN